MVAGAGFEIWLPERRIRKIRVWGRSQRKARAVVEKVRVSGEVDITVTANLGAASREADIISAATMAREPLIHGSWLKAGVHIDLVGAFSPDMRETDSDVLRRADLIYVDTHEGARAEAGDIISAIDEGALGWDNVSGSLYELAGMTETARTNSDEISVFKSVGTGLEDLAAAALCFRKQQDIECD